MKRTNLMLCCVLVLLWSSMAWGAPPQQAEFSLQRSVVGADIDYQTYIDVNEILMFVTNQGSFAYDNGAMFGKADGFYFPKGTKLSVIYAGGLWLGGKIGGDLRVSLGEYSHTYWPGPIVDGTFIEDANDDPQYRVYKIIKTLRNEGFYDITDIDSLEAEAADSMVDLWYDYQEWPADMGAPMETVWIFDDEDTDSTEVTRPKMTGDQTLWCVYNDLNPATHDNSAGSDQGLGIEVQQTTFAFNRTGALGQCVFIKFLMINKGGNTIEDMFVSVWADPDLGDASDDFDGCDVDLSLGYCYNATNNDANYGKTPPAVGYDFFQGPMVPSPGDVAEFPDGRVFPDYRILPMTSYNKYINGTDPDNAQETYWYMQGLDAKNSGAQVVDPTTGETTLFMLSGDPTAGTGWLDSDPADRRYMCSSGPFVMAPGDTQEVVISAVVGQGSDRLTSVTAMKFNDLFAQSAFDANFDLPEPPARPIVNATAVDGGIVLDWGIDSEVKPGDYAFQGYNVYQGESKAGPWKRIATFDIDDGAGIIFDLEFVVEEGAVILHPVQYGSDTGIRRYIQRTEDAIAGGPLYNIFDYYWAVTAYSYDPNEVPKTLENAPAVITVTPQKSAGGYVYPMDYGEIIPVEHPQGASDGTVEPLVVDPRVLTGDDYTVTFTEDEEGNVLWHLFDVDTDDFVLQDQTNQTGDEDYPIVDGFRMKVAGPPQGVNTVFEIDSAGVTLAVPDNVFYSWNSSGDYYTSSDDGSNIDRLNWRGHIGTDDWEFRFTAGGSEYYDWISEELFAGLRVPFEVWNIGSATPDDETDDKRIQIAIIDDDASGDWSPGDRIYPSEVVYVEPLPTAMEYVWDDDFKIGRIQINAGIPAEGTVIRWTTNKVNATNDLFTFTAPAAIDSNLAADAAYDMKSIKVVPNPYFNQALYEEDQFDRQVRFTNLPHKCEIKIFNLAGDHIVTLNKEPSEESFLIWGMLTKHGLPLASGVYIYLVTAEGAGEFIGKMAVFTEVEQLNTF